MKTIFCRMSTSTTTEKTIHPSETLSKVEDTLTEKVAENEADEMFLGEPAEGEIIDVRTEDTSEDDTVIEFDVLLPNEKTGTISFSEFDFEEGRVEEFLNNIDCTINDTTDAMYHSVPVTFTNWKGWVVLYGESKHLDATFSGESKLYKIDEKRAAPRPNRLYSTVLGLAFYIGVAASIVMWDLFPLVIGGAISVFLWYLNCVSVGMSSPRRKHIKID